VFLLRLMILFFFSTKATHCTKVKMGKVACLPEKLYYVLGCDCFTFDFPIYIRNFRSPQMCEYGVGKFFIENY